MYPPKETFYKTAFSPLFDVYVSIDIRMTTASGFTLAVLFIKRASTFKITFFANANLRGFVYEHPYAY
jgi:hypothetical protein